MFCRKELNILRKSEILKSCLHIVNEMTNKANFQVFKENVSPLALVCQGCRNKISQTGDLNESNLFCHSSAHWKSKISVPARLVSPEASLPALQMAAFSLCPHLAFPLCTGIPSVSSLLLRTPVLLDQNPTLIISLHPAHLFKGLFSKHSHILRYQETEALKYWDLKLQHMNFEEMQNSFHDTPEVSNKIRQCIKLSTKPFDFSL